MRLNFRPDRVAYIDFETQSRQDLSLGAKKYASHPSTRILTCCVKVDGQMYTMGPYLEPQDMEFLAALSDDYVLVAHNAPFDAAVWEAAGLPECEWFDTLPCTRAAGLPGPLDLAGKALGFGGKDVNGERLISMLCILKGAAPAVGPAHKLLIEYNRRDVELLEHLYSKVRGYGEPDVMVVDRIINDRGIPADRGHLEKLEELFSDNKLIKETQFCEAADVNPRSSKQVLAWLEGKGFVPGVIKDGEFKPGTNKAAMKAFYEDPESMFLGDGDFAQSLEIVQHAMELRREVVGVGPGKVKAALSALDDDGRMRDQLVIYGAGPGRWAGRKFQPHNLPSILSRSVDFRNVEMTYNAVSAVAAEAKVPTADVLAGMLRHAVKAPMSVADYAQVEARCVAWLADEQRMLDIFADPRRSIYVDMGEKLYGRTISKKDDQYEYVLCKALVLGCTYGMSGAKFAYTCNVRGESKALQTMLDAGMTADDAVRVYRKSYPAIPALWRTYGDAVMQAVQGCATRAGRCDFYVKGSDLHIVLPSGRPIVYRNVRLEPMVPAYCKMYNMPEVPIPTVVYDHPKGYRGFLYGSKVCENVSQGTCRDLLAIALVNLEQQSMLPFIHVHDEAGCESEKLEELVCTMSDQPEWARGFPILVEGYFGPMWTKNTKGYREAAAVNGKVIHG